MISVSRTTLTIGPVQLRFYALCIVAGMVAALALAGAREKRLGLPKDTAADLMLWCIPAALLGARLYYVLFALDEYIGRPLWSILAVWEGGLAIYGGVLAGLLTGYLFSRKQGLSFAALADLAAPCIALGQAIGRWGNFINQECHGGLVEGATLRFFPMAVEIGGEWYYATFFYESVWCLAIVAVLLYLEKRERLPRRGDGLLLYAFLYALERACVEGLRTDSLYLGSLRVSQGLSLLAALCVCLWWAVRLRRRTPLALIAPVSAIAATAGAAVGCLPAVFIGCCLALPFGLYTCLSAGPVPEKVK